MEGSPKDYWRNVCAPRLRERKKALGDRKLPQQEISSYIESRTGKPAGRAAAGHFLSGEREPYFSQFIALCAKLEIDPAEVVKPPKSTPPPMRRVNESAAVQRLRDKRRRIKS